MFNSLKSGLNYVTSLISSSDTLSSENVQIFLNNSNKYSLLNSILSPYFEKSPSSISNILKEIFINSEISKILLHFFTINFKIVLNMIL
jgi:hypothetical protein